MSGSRTAPDLVHGAWMRRSASLEGGPHFETQHVIWLQAATCYADIRVPLHPAAQERCFAGRSGWEGNGYRWSHQLDLETVAGVAPPAADDVGELSWSDGVLVERGKFPTVDGEVMYEEIWAPLPGATGPFMALEAPDACLVRVGDHAITVWDRRASGGVFSACYRHRGAAGRWITVAAIGKADDLPAPDSQPGGVPSWVLVHRGRVEP
jgi:hypothetical protein